MLLSLHVIVMRDYKKKDVLPFIGCWEREMAPESSKNASCPHFVYFSVQPGRTIELWQQA